MCSLLFNHLQIHNKCIFYEFLNETEKATPNYTVADCRVSNNHFQLMIFWFFWGGGVAPLCAVDLMRLLLSLLTHSHTSELW